MTRGKPFVFALYQMLPDINQCPGLISSEENAGPNPLLPASMRAEESHGGLVCLSSRLHKAPVVNGKQNSTGLRRSLATSRKRRLTRRVMPSASLTPLEPQSRSGDKLLEI